MARITATKNGDGTITIDCGCVYFADNARTPMRTCEQHRWITCAQCGGKAEVTFIGVWCQLLLTGG